MHGCGDIAVDELQAVVTVDGLGLIGESKAEERPIKPISRSIAGKDSSRSISAMSGGSKSDDQKASAGITKTGNRSSPIVPVAKPFYLFSGDLFPILDQSLASPAVNDFSLSAGPSRPCHSQW